MLVKYIRNGVSGKIGDIRNHGPATARVLIKLGIVIPADQHIEIAPKPSSKNQAFGNLPKLSAKTNAKISTQGQGSGNPTGDTRKAAGRPRKTVVG